MKDISTTKLNFKESITNALVEFDRSFGVLVAGCDEAGRGPLAGPLVCAACIMPLDNVINGINDSKALSEQKRELLYKLIVASAMDYQVSVIDEKTIDEINILNATKLAMRSTVDALSAPQLVLIDAVKIESVHSVLPVIKGDAKSYNIAAASIIAKVTRDRIMRGIDVAYPEYGFGKHKGYGTKQHIESIRKFGACEHHRMTFIKNFVENK